MGFLILLPRDEFLAPISIRKPVADKNHLHFGDVGPGCQNWHGQRPPMRKLPGPDLSDRFQLESIFLQPPLSPVVDPGSILPPASFHELENSAARARPVAPAIVAFSKRN